MGRLAPTLGPTQNQRAIIRRFYCLLWRPFSCSSHRIRFKCSYPATLCQIASNPIVASLKLLARRGLTTRSTGHFAAVQFWAQEPSPKSAHRKVPVSSNVRPHPKAARIIRPSSVETCGAAMKTDRAEHVFKCKSSSTELLMRFVAFVLVLKLSVAARPNPSTRTSPLVKSGF